MTSFDAQEALDAIHQRQEQTRDEYVRHNSSGLYGFFAALAVFAGGSSVDLPSPWSLVARLVATGLIVGGLIVQYRRTRVRRKATLAETMFLGWVAVAIVVLFIAATICAHLLDLPIPSMAAAAVAAVATLVATYAGRPIIKRITRRDG
ncbi:hypothetical protein ACFU7T_23245 [Streptomyces sp. NPDC057555]|uniref:hypothetical protein n=1 Tax=Streptomyces sp. NPDC057555 TaxID=3346166 RepID=UPI0036AE3AFC